MPYNRVDFSGNAQLFMNRDNVSPEEVKTIINDDDPIVTRSTHPGTPGTVVVRKPVAADQAIRVVLSESPASVAGALDALVLKVSSENIPT